MNHTTRVYDDILQMLPSEHNPSPLVRINKLNPNPAFKLYAKLEWLNPFGSVKDRAAQALIHDLEQQGKLNHTRSLLEPTSGNTGISLAAMAKAKGYKTRAVIPAKVPLEKKILLKIAGAQLEVINDGSSTPSEHSQSAVDFAKTYARMHDDTYVMPNQYENESNANAHYTTTGPEIWKQTEGKLTHLIVSLGSCGTATGCSKFLREKNPDIKIIAVQPTEGHDIPGARNCSELDVSRLYDPSLIDEIIEIDYKRAYTRAVELFQQEGLRAGPSSGLIFEAAHQIASRETLGHAVMIFSDDIFKYASHMTKHIAALSDNTDPPHEPACQSETLYA